MSSYYRTEALKTSHYFGNGEGRDTYIMVNNGGIERNTYPYKFSDESRTTKRYYLAGSPNLGAKPIKYNTNGTGRDTYIAFNHGGLISHGGKSSFYTSLRTPSPSHCKMYTTQNQWQHAKQLNSYKLQRDASMRLSVPKFGNPTNNKKKL